MREEHSIPTSIGLLIMRVGLGAYMMTHGIGKVEMVLDGNTKEFADPLGIGHQMSAIGAAGSEFIFPALVILGLGTRVSALPIVFTMLVAAFVVHGGDPWLMGEGKSKEPALLYALPFLALVFTGGGRFALDSLIFKGKRGQD